MSVSVQRFREVLSERFGGRLSAGRHCDTDGAACAIEAAAAARGLWWTDDPAIVGLPDLRDLNDGPWASDARRTEAIAPVVEALWDWTVWTPARRRDWAQTVALGTVREILPHVLRAFGLPEHAAACARATSRRAAIRASQAAERALVSHWPTTSRLELAILAVRAAGEAVQAASMASTNAAARAAARATARVAAAVRSHALAATARRESAEAAAAEAAEAVMQRACRIWRESAGECEQGDAL
jgi:hypothetical protein